MNSEVMIKSRTVVELTGKPLREVFTEIIE